MVRLPQTASPVLGSEHDAVNADIRGSWRENQGNHRDK